MHDLAAVKIGFLGAGQMATALAKGWLHAGCVTAEQLVAYDVVSKAADHFRAETGARLVADGRALLVDCDVVFLAIKPQQLSAALSPLAGQWQARHLAVSIVAGAGLVSLWEQIGEAPRVIRVMPNTPCLVGAGASAYALGPTATTDDARLVQSLLSAGGFAAEVPERLLDAVTGLSGSGPAYVYVMIEALSDGGVRMGLPRSLATQLAAQTVLGAAQMALTTGQHPGVLKDAVASPGGTTIAGLHALERGHFRGTIMDAVEASTNRARELG